MMLSNKNLTEILQVNKESSYGSMYSYSKYGHHNEYTEYTYRTEPPKSTPRPEPIEVELQLTVFELFTGCVKIVKINRREWRDYGMVTRLQNLDVTVPPGAKNSMKITLQGKGHRTPDHVCGDVIVKLKDIHHKTFKRDGNDVHQIVYISQRHFEIGGEVPIVFLDKTTGWVAFEPRKLVKRLPSLGLPLLNKPKKRGDLVIELKVKNGAVIDQDNKITKYWKIMRTKRARKY